MSVIHWLCAIASQATLTLSDCVNDQLLSGEAKIKNVNKPLLGHFEKAGVLPKRKLMEFKVSQDCVIPVGTKISALHFVPGQVS